MRPWPVYAYLLQGTGGERCSPFGEAEKEAFEVLRKSFAELEDTGSMAGVAFLRDSSTVDYAVVDAEVARR